MVLAAALVFRWLVSVVDAFAFVVLVLFFMSPFNLVSFGGVHLLLVVSFGLG